MEEEFGKENNKNQELLRVRKKYSPKYILIEKLMEVYIVMLLFVGLCFYGKRFGYGIFAIFVLMVIVLLNLIIRKRNAQKTYMIFYEDRIVCKTQILWMKSEKTLLYSEIKDITFTQGATFWERRFQKSMHLGNIYVYPKKGNILTNGMRIELVAKIEETVEKIKNIVGDKIG